MSSQTYRHSHHHQKNRRTFAGSLQMPGPEVTIYSSTTGLAATRPPVLLLQLFKAARATRSPWTCRRSYATARYGEAPQQRGCDILHTSVLYFTLFGTILYILWPDMKIFYTLRQ
eukprot:3824038-Pleurochrysis_carterae.AAC.1